MLTQLTTPEQSPTDITGTPHRQPLPSTTPKTAEQQLPSETQTHWAIRLLTHGMSAREVSNTVGISRRQVGKLKEHLETINGQAPWSRPDIHPTSKTETYRNIHILACRPTGVKRSELFEEFANLYGFKIDEYSGKSVLSMSRHQYQYLKEKIRGMPSEVPYTPLFVPEWMPRENAPDAFRALLELADNLLTRITEDISSFCQQFPECSPNSVRNELLSLSIEGFSPRPLLKICEHNESISEQLSSRVVTTKTDIIESPMSGFPSDLELDSLCH